MKKFYTLALMLALTASSVAAITVKKRGSDLKPQKNVTLEKEFKSLPLLPPSAQAAPTVAVAPVKAPAQKDLYGTYSTQFRPLLNSMTVSSGDVEVFQDSYAETDIDFAFPGWDADLPFYGHYDAEKGTVTFEWQAFAYANAAQTLYVVQAPLMDAEEVEELTITYDEATKSFVFPKGAGLAMAQYTSQGSLNGYYWAADNITLVRPDGDYSLKINIDDECSPNNSFPFSIEAGADIAQIRAIMMPGDNEAALANQFGLFDMQNAYIVLEAATTYTLTNALAQMEETGKYSILLAGYNKAGEQVKLAQQSVIFVIDNPEDWATVSNHEYEDAIVSQYYNNFSQKTTVLLQENINTPGVFRFTNPYAGQPSIHQEGCAHYLTFDITDPDFANILFSPTGMDPSGDGHLVIGGCAALGYDKPEADRIGFVYGSADGRKITFPPKSIFAHEYYFNGPGSWGYATSEPVVFQLPDITLQLTATDVNGNPAKGVRFSYVEQPAQIDCLAREGAQEYSAVSDENGVATLSLPASVDYLQTVDIRAEGDGGVLTSSIKLNGAENNVTFDASKVTTGIASINAQAAPARYFNLQGIEVSEPQPGQVLIRRSASKSEKIRF